MGEILDFIKMAAKGQPYNGDGVIKNLDNILLEAEENKIINKKELENNIHN